MTPTSVNLGDKVSVSVSFDVYCGNVKCQSVSTTTLVSIYLYDGKQLWSLYNTTETVTSPSFSNTYTVTPNASGAIRVYVTLAGGCSDARDVQIQVISGPSTTCNVINNGVPDSYVSMFNDVCSYISSQGFKLIPPCGNGYVLAPTSGNYAYTYYGSSCVEKIEYPSNASYRLIAHETAHLIVFPCMFTTYDWIREGFAEGTAAFLTESRIGILAHYFTSRFFSDRMYERNPYNVTLSTPNNVVYDYGMFFYYLWNKYGFTPSVLQILCDTAQLHQSYVDFLKNIVYGVNLGGTTFSPSYYTEGPFGILPAYITVQLDGLSAKYYNIKSAYCLDFTTNNENVDIYAPNKCPDNDGNIYIAIVNKSTNYTTANITINRSTSPPPPPTPTPTIWQPPTPTPTPTQTWWPPSTPTPTQTWWPPPPTPTPTIGSCTYGSCMLESTCSNMQGTCVGTCPGGCCCVVTQQPPTTSQPNQHKPCNGICTSSEYCYNYGGTCVDTCEYGCCCMISQQPQQPQPQQPISMQMGQTNWSDLITVVLIVALIRMIL